MALGTIVPTSQPSYGQSGRDTYFCDTNNSPPTTIARTAGVNRPLITWQSTRSGLTPRQRCLEVSARFDNYSQKGQLRFIKVATLRRQPILCVASFKDGPCVGVLITLSNRAEAQRVQQRLMNSGVLATGAISQGSAQSIYIDLDKYLQTSSDDPLLEF